MSQINNLSSHLKKLKTEEQNKPKANSKGRQQRAEINEIKSRKIIGKINKTEIVL